VFVNQKVYIIKICNWAFLGLNVRVDYYFLIDTVSFSFMLLTTTIAFFVFIYAFSYFRYEPLVDRFLLFILSFVISMLFLVTSGNTIMLFLGWELIGLTSFLLINFWTTKAATLKSAFKAFTFNKVSDFFMFMFLISTYSVFYTFDILSINNQIFKFESSIIYIFNTPINFLEFLSFTIIGAAFIKSAQMGGHVWLPDSMEAPVPASSLIHSATLVSAGVYLILRFNFIFDLTQLGKVIVPVVGSLTAAYGGVCAVAQSDIKKTLAYSTISHCGFLMVLCSTEMNEFTILYLYVHGFFKAGVFMCVGNVLRVTRGYQDTRRMGGLLKYLPFEYFCATVGLLNLAGLPFTFGFFIKHLLLISLDDYIYLYYFVIFNCLIGAFAGLFYSYRLVSYTFNDFKKGNKVLYFNLNRVNYNSSFYTNSSLAATYAIFFLFLSAYIITYFMFKYFLYSNYLFSDFMNTTVLTNYYTTLTTFNGYLLNFSYINLTVVTICLALLFSKYRRTPRIHILFKFLNYFVMCFLFFFIFYMLI
jgi:NADH:ubiquinone oxidoreductase subunit 5 (subunit L)/multisubunit Na+/H+ antiporter MnhA subunit